MLRRIALGAFAIPFLLRPAWSQGQPPVGRTTEPARQSEVPPSQIPQPTLEGDSPARDAARRGGDPMLAAMAMALASAELGVRLAASGTAKVFAELEVEEQTAFANARRLGGLPVPSPDMLSAPQRATLARLESQRGADFDRMLVAVQTEGHQELLRLHRTALQRPENREEAMLLTVGVPAIRSHIAMLGGLELALRG